MSETKPAREGVEQVRTAAQAAVDSTVRTSKATMSRSQDAFNRTADETQNIGSHVADTMARGAEAATDIAQRSAEQSREVVWLGMRTAAGVNGRLADVSYDRGHRTLESAAHALEIYRQAGESAAEKVQSLFATYQQLGRGVQQMQVAYMQMIDRALHQATRKPQDLLRATSIKEFAEIQRDLYLDAVNLAFEASSTLLQIAGRTAQQAAPHAQDQTKIVRP
jgi:Phasin protein